MIDAEQFVALLESKDLVPPEVIAHLRRQVARPGNPISAALIAKWLVDRGHLSRLLAQRLLTQAEESVELGRPQTPAQFDWEKQAAAEEELGLAPLDDEIPKLRPAEKKPAAAPRPQESRPEAHPAAPGYPQEPPRQPPQRAPAESLLDEALGLPGGVASAPAAPLGGLAEGAALAAPGAGAGPLATLGPRKKGLFGLGRSRRRRGRRRNVWDSPLLLLGGGGLLLLVVVGAILFWALNRQTGDQSLAIADEFYRAGSYTKAIAQYDAYLKNFPKHKDVSAARVRRGLAQLRQATDYSSDWPGALEVAGTVLGEIAQEEAFPTEGRAELTAILPKIAEGLAGKARADLDPNLVAKTEEAVKLVEKYVAPSARPVTKLDDIRAILGLTRRDIARGEELKKAIAAMKKAVAENNPALAYQTRAALLKVYPELADDVELRETVLAVAEAELAAVRPVEKVGKPEAAVPPPPTLATAVLARRDTRAAPPGAEGHVIYVLARGAAYGLDASSGKILWRRPVGFAETGRSPAFPPTSISEKPQSDAIMVDAERNEVLRVEAATGQLRWRHPLGERFDAHPVVAGTELLVATRSGRLVRIELETGDSSGYIQFPQGLRVGPAVDIRRASMFQVAEHSNLFVLSYPEGKPKQVVYLGHAPGSISVPPVVVNRYLVVAENEGVEHSMLRVLTLEGEGKEEKSQPPVHIVQSVRLKGHVDAAPRVSGTRLLVATDQGELRVFEISTDAKNPLARVAEGQASGEKELASRQVAEGMIRFPLMLGGQVWIADDRLTQYDLQPSQGRLQARGVRNERSATMQPLVAIGQTVFHVRSRLGLPGVLVSAIGADEKEPYWETHLAAPLATEPWLDPQSGRITAVTSVGAIFELDSAALEGQAFLDAPAVALKLAEVPAPVSDVLRVEDRLVVMATGTGQRQFPVYDPHEARRFRLLFLPDALSGHPVAYRDGLLVPCEIGQVFWLDPRTGAQRSEPFQPPLAAGDRVGWTRPAVLGDSEVLISDGRSGLYRIGMKDQPKPHLAVLAEAALSERLVSPIAVVGNFAFAVDAADSLVTFELPKLAAGQPRPLGAKVAWGPASLGEHVLLATEDDRLLCFDASQKLVWEQPLPYGPLAGAPLATETGYVLAAASGVIWRLDPASGREVARIETGYPLGTGPVPLGQDLLVGGHDGCLFKVRRP